MRAASGQALADAGRLLDPALALANRIARGMAWIGGTLLLLAAATVSVDVVVRKLFRLSLGGADELSGYAFAIGVAWALPFALLQRANIRIDALYTKLPARAAAVLDVAALLAMAVFVTVLTRYAWEVVAGSCWRSPCCCCSWRWPSRWPPRSACLAWRWNISIRRCRWCGPWAK